MMFLFKYSPDLDAAPNWNVDNEYQQEFDKELI